MDMPPEYRRPFGGERASPVQQFGGRAGTPGSPPAELWNGSRRAGCDLRGGFPSLSPATMICNVTTGSVTRFRNLIDALAAAPGDRPFVTAWIDEDERETVTFAEFRSRARVQARVLRDHGVTAGDRVIVIMPQSISAMTTFVGAMMLGAVPAFLAYPNFKVEASKYRSGLAGVTANLRAKVVVIDEEFPDDMLGHVSLGRSEER